MCYVVSIVSDMCYVVSDMCYVVSIVSDMCYVVSDK